MYDYKFRIAYTQEALEISKPYLDDEEGSYPPIFYILCHMQSDSMRGFCIPQYFGDEGDIAILRGWLAQNGAAPAPEKFNPDSCAPQNMYWSLASPRGRKTWAWELETEDPANFDAVPDTSTVDEEGEEIIY